MKSKIYQDNDADLSYLKGKKIAILGLGSQGFAHAQNLKDSKLHVVVGLRPGSASRKKAQQASLEVSSIENAVKNADLIAFLVPDMVQAELYQTQVLPHLKEGACLLFAHGFNIHFGLIDVPSHCDVVMVAPKGPGNLVRETYVAGQGVPCLVAVKQDATNQAINKVLAYAKALGGTRAGVIQTTFQEETETDLFGEQAVLCGGVVSLVKKGFETLVEAGYQKEVAYFECMHELKLIVDLLNRSGIDGMRRAVSETAKFGDVTRGPRVVGESARQEMKKILDEIQSGQFAREWIDENEQGLVRYRNLLQQDQNHVLEQTGRQLRMRMSWLIDESNATQDPVSK